MCLAIPGKVIDINGDMATVEIAGNTREIGFSLTPEAGLGDYVLVHAGFSIEIVDKYEAQEILKLLEEWADQETLNW